MKIAILGAGKVGTALGEGWARAGHDVVYGVRDPAKADGARPGAAVATVRGAVERSEVAVLATPWAAAKDALAAAGDLAGKILVDATNPIGPGFALAVGKTTSGGEELAKVARGAHVVKAFNTTGVENMSDPRFGARRALMLAAGDDAGATAAVAGLAKELGFDALALAGLSHARELEPLAMLWISLAMQGPLGRGFAFVLGRGGARFAHRPAATKRSIAVYGGGNIGGALAEAWSASGHDVRVVERGARAGAAEVVVLAVPYGAVEEVLAVAGDLRGKILVDCTNAIGPGMSLQYGHTTSSAEQIAAKAPGARVVRAFNQQGAETLRAPIFGGAPAATFVAADDGAARDAVVSLASDVGLEGISAGPLAAARWLEPITLAWIAASQSLGTRDFGLGVARR